MRIRTVMLPTCGPDSIIISIVLGDEDISLTSSPRALSQVTTSDLRAPHAFACLHLLANGRTELLVTGWIAQYIAFIRA